MTKTELEKQIAEMQEQFDKMQDELNKLKQVKVEEPKRWKPEVGDLYYCVCDGGTIIQDVWEDCITDNWRYLTGNIFKTKQEAEEHKKKIEIQAQFKNFVEEHSEKLDWTDAYQKKYHIYYCHSNKTIETDWLNTSKIQGAIYASDAHILRDAINELGEENIKKYVLEVYDEE